MKYTVLTEDPSDTDVFVTDLPKGVRATYQLVEGVSRIDGWPDDVALHFSDDFPERVGLTDNIANTHWWLIVSSAMRKIIQAHQSDDLEFLPVSIRNHKGRVAADNYSIVNFLRLIEVVDRGASEFRVDAAYDDQISKYYKLILRKDIEEIGPAILRMKETPMLILVREDLAMSIEASGMTGVTFVRTDEYTTFPS